MTTHTPKNKTLKEAQVITDLAKSQELDRSASKGARLIGADSQARDLSSSPDSSLKKWK